MIPIFWEKKIIAEINLYEKDTADEFKALPLFVQMSWNHYIGFYFELIKQFYGAWLPYPIQDDQFHIKIQGIQQKIVGTQIISNLVSLYQIGLNSPLQITCYFRSFQPYPLIQLKKHFKQNLKSSTCIRNSRYGSSILTVQMSIQNVERMFNNFFNNDLLNYLGSEDFNSQQLGFKFVKSKTQKVPVKILNREFVIQRGVGKMEILGNFINQIFGQRVYEKKQQQKNSIDCQRQNNVSIEVKSITQPNQNQQKSIKLKQTNTQIQTIQQNIHYNAALQKYHIQLHGVRLKKVSYQMSFFERYCHPDGYLYLIFLGQDKMYGNIKSVSQQKN